MDAMLNFEKWVPVYGFEGFYEVSSFGRVRSVDHYTEPKIDSMGRRQPRTLMRGKIISQRKHQFGYWVVTLSKNNKVFTRVVHRLVAEGFYGARPKGNVIRHLNGNPEDNRVENLAYGTQKENMQDAIEQNTLEYGERRFNALHTNEEIKQLKRDLICGMTTGEAAKKYKMPQSQVWKVAMGRAWGRVGLQISRSKKCKFLTDEEKAKAVARYKAGDCSVSKLAEELGVSGTQIWNAIRKSKDEN